MAEATYTVRLRIAVEGEEQLRRLNQAFRQLQQGGRRAAGGTSIIGNTVSSVLQAADVGKQAADAAGQAAAATLKAPFNVVGAAASQATGSLINFAGPIARLGAISVGAVPTIAAVGLAVIAVGIPLFNLAATLKILRASFGWAADAAESQLRSVARTRRNFPEAIAGGFAEARSRTETKLALAGALFGPAADSIAEGITRRFTEARMGRGLMGDTNIFERWGITPENIAAAEAGSTGRLTLTDWLFLFIRKREELEARQTLVAPGSAAERTIIQKRATLIDDSLKLFGQRFSDLVGAMTQDDFQRLNDNLSKAGALSDTTDATGQSARDFKVSLETLQFTFQQLKEGIAGDVAPILTDMMDKLRIWMLDVEEGGGGMGRSFRALGEALGIKAWEAMANIIEDIDPEGIKAFIKVIKDHWEPQETINNLRKALPTIETLAFMIGNVIGFLVRMVTHAGDYEEYHRLRHGGRVPLIDRMREWWRTGKAPLGGGWVQDRNGQWRQAAPGEIESRAQDILRRNTGRGGGTGAAQAPPSGSESRAGITQAPDFGGAVSPSTNAQLVRQMNLQMAPAGTRPGGDTVTITSPSGRKFQIAREFAPNFQGFINDYERAGGVIGPASGGLSARPGNASYHPKGYAIDVNQVGYGIRATTGKTLPREKEEQLAAEWGLFPGSQFRGRSDIGHFEVRNREAAQQALARKQAAGGAAVAAAPEAGPMPETTTPAGGGGAVKEMQGSVAATRRQALAGSTRGYLEYAAAQAGVNVEVFSGGQAAIGTGGPRTGSTRHDLGGAADVKLRDPNTGELLDMRKPEDAARMSKFTEAAVRAGATGVGAGLGYMGPNSIHIGGGREATWGGAGWIPEAAARGRATRAQYRPGTTQTPPVTLAAYTPEDEQRAQPLSGGPGGGDNALAEQRARFKNELRANPNLRLQWAALMTSEQAGAARQTVGETMVNRANAWGTSLQSIVGNRRYYEPYQNNSYNRNLAKLQRDPEEMQKIFRMQDDILAGSNRSNLSTHNASAGVAARAQAQQTVGSQESGETYTRKDIRPDIHGPGVVAKERSWYQRTVDAMRSGRKPTNVAEQLTAEKLADSKRAEEMKKEADENRKTLTEAPPKRDKEIKEGTAAGEAAAKSFKEGIKDVAIPVKSLDEGEKEREQKREDRTKEAA